MILPESKVILFKGKKLKDNSHPIVLQIKVGTNDYRRISLSMSAKDREWNATDARYRDSASKEFENRELFEQENKAQDLLNESIKKMRDERMPFDYLRFKNKFLGKIIEDGNKPKNLLGFIHWYAEQLREKNKLGTLTTFTTLHSVLITHGCTEKVMLDDVDIDFLEKFERDLVKRKNKHTGEPIKKGSVFSYFKNLKTIFNKAIYYKLTTHYPFKNRANPWGYSFSHLTSPRISKSMSNEDVKKFFDFDWKNGSRKQKLAWKISYFIYQYRGIPIGDAARLTIKDIANDQVMFGRIKTSNKVPNIPINERRKWILDLLKKDTDGIHLLPILHKGRHDTPQSILNRINKMKTLVNTGMKEIAEIQGIKMNLSTYTLRHTFSRKVLEEYGIWHLKEIHGHKSVNTTQHYANSLSSKELEITDSVFD